MGSTSQRWEGGSGTLHGTEFLQHQIRRENKIYIDHAIIVAAGAGLGGESLSSLARIPIGGIPQLKRLVITAERAGIKQITIISDNNDSKLKDVITRDKNVKSRIDWQPQDVPIKLQKGPYLILQSNLIITPRVLSNFINRDISENEVALLYDENKDNSTVNPNKPSNEDFSPYGGLAVGAFMCYGTILEKLAANSMDLGRWAKELAHNEKIKPFKLIDNHWMHFTSDRNSIKKAEDLLFFNIRKSERGWMSRNINRRISVPISNLLIRTPITPNVISVLVGIIGILSGVYYALGHIILGGIFIELSSILDGCDGEVAKMKLMESKVGQWIDTISDQLSYAAFIIGVPIGYWISSGKSISLVIGAINLGLYIFCILWGIYFLNKYSDSGSMVSYPSTIDKLVPLEQRYFIYKLVYLVRPLLQREYLAFIVFLASIIGGYILVLSITTITFVLTAIHVFDDILMINMTFPQNTKPL